MAKRQAILTVFFSICTHWFAGCAPGPLLSGVAIDPSTISPNADGINDVARIPYALSQPAEISVYLQDTAGDRHYFRQNNRRPAGDYEALFGGVIDGAMLPNGTYSLIVEAVAASGERMSQSGELIIVDADTQPPQMVNFTVFPTTFTPNQDGIDDRVAISFLLEEKAEAQVYLQDEAGHKYPVGRPRSFGLREEELAAAEEPQWLELTPGLVEFDYDGGIDLGINPPADGNYLVVAIARDKAGNTVQVKSPLSIKEGGLPLAAVKFVDFTPLVLPLGQSLRFTAIVENVGGVPIRTYGPESGMAYHSQENFNTLGFFESDGVFRIGVDFEGNSLGRRYPYRWQLGRSEELTPRVIDGQAWYYLLPGQRVTVEGEIILDEAPPRPNPFFWVGLIHEGVRIVNDYQEPTRISIGY